MTTQALKIKNSTYILIPNELIEKFGLNNSIKLTPLADGILIHSKDVISKPKKKAREGWAAQFAKAMANGDTTDEELL